MRLVYNLHKLKCRFLCPDYDFFNSLYFTNLLMPNLENDNCDYGYLISKYRAYNRNN